MRRSLLTLVALAVLALAATARADGPMEFTTAKISGTKGSTEPRGTIAPDGTRYIDTSVAPGSHEQVFKSIDGGVSWVPVEGTPPQAQPTIDVDTIAMPTGRVLASELDEGGLNFPTAVSD